MNSKLLILGLLVVGAIGASFLFTADTPKVPEVPDTTNPPLVQSLANETKLCYLREFQGALPAGVAPDIDYLELQLDPVTHAAVGIYNWIPSGKDSSRGEIYGKYEPDAAMTTLTGTESLLVKGTYLYMIEGSEEGREMYIKFNKLEAQIGKGELSGDGTRILKYRDISTLTYNESFPRVDCSIVKPEHITVPPRGNGGES